MLNLRSNLKVFLSNKPTDMRKSIDGLSILILDSFKEKPESEHLFIFFNKAKDKVKILFWDRNGFVIYYKRLEKSKFKISLDATIVQLTEEQLHWLLAGLDFDLMDKFSELSYSNYF